MGTKRIFRKIDAAVRGTAEQEVRLEILEKVGMNKRNAILKSLGFPVDRKTGTSPALQEFFNTDKTRAQAMFFQVLRQVTEYMDSPQCTKDIDRLLNAKLARIAKRKNQGR